MPVLIHSGSIPQIRRGLHQCVDRRRSRRRGRSWSPLARGIARRTPATPPGRSCARLVIAIVGSNSPRRRRTSGSPANLRRTRRNRRTSSRWRRSGTRRRTRRSLARSAGSPAWVAGRPASCFPTNSAVRYICGPVVTGASDHRYGSCAIASLVVGYPTTTILRHRRPRARTPDRRCRSWCSAGTIDRERLAARSPTRHRQLRGFVAAGRQHEHELERAAPRLEARVVEDRVASRAASMNEPSCRVAWFSGNAPPGCPPPEQ